jgi:hypothetical protein
MKGRFGQLLRVQMSFEMGRRTQSENALTLTKMSVRSWVSVGCTTNCERREKSVV